MIPALYGLHLASLASRKIKLLSREAQALTTWPTAYVISAKSASAASRSGSEGLDMAKPPDEKPDVATEIMKRMVRMPPKPHEDMKVGKRKPKAGATGRQRKPPKR